MHGRATTVATFEDHASAERAIDALRDAGYAADQIGFAGNDPEGITTRLVEEHGNAAGQGALGGLVTGAAVGGSMAWIGLAAIPAIGPILAGGAIGSALIGAAAGGATGGVLGGLLGLGIPRHDAELHEERVRSGRTIVSVHGDNVADTETLLTDAGAIDVRRYVMEPEPVGAGTTRTDDRG